MLGILRLKPLLPRPTLVLIYNSLILPHFHYCTIVWDNLGKGLGQKLQRLQNRAARILTESDYNVRSSDILTLLNWSNLETRRTQQFKTVIYKSVNGMVPNYLSNKFSPISTVHAHNLRGNLVPRVFSLVHNAPDTPLRKDPSIVWSSVSLNLGDSKKNPLRWAIE